MHPANTVLDQALDRYGHMPIRALRWAPGSLTIVFPTCGDYDAATSLDKRARDNGRLVGGSRSPRRIYDHLDPEGTVLEHICWPHLDCWEGNE